VTGSTAQKPAVHFGAAYYPEYAPEARLATDLELMRRAGFTVIRVGESVWSTWEPRDGEFDLEWLCPVLDAAHANGISAVLGTPTYAVPPWLMRKHPGIAAQDASGSPVPWGSRQEIDITNPDFRRHAERVIRAVVGRYAAHPAVVGFQVDNEPGNLLLHNAGVFARFKDFLIDEYGSVAELNTSWNLAHWSHRLSDIDELWQPAGNHVPQYELAWRRFQAALTTEYIAWQAAIVREYASPAQWVTTCVDFARPAVDDKALAECLDVPAANLYIATQAGLDNAAVGDPAFPLSGSSAPFYGADRCWAAGDRPFLVTETNAGSIGFPWFNFPAYDGQLRQAAWAMVARGARAVEYWQWHTMHASWETSWGGILPHSYLPGRTYDEIAGIGTELARAGAAMEGLVPDAHTGLLYSLPSRWAMEFQPPLARPGGDPGKQGERDAEAYERIVYRFYCGLSRAGHQLRILHADRFEQLDAASLATSLPTLVAPALYIAGDALVANLRAYAAAGGHLVLGVRSACADDIGRVRSDRQPAGLAAAASCWYDEFSNLIDPVPVSGTLSGAATGLIEGLVADGADVLASYRHPHFGRWAAITSAAHGAGRITYVGTVPDPVLAESLGRWLAAPSPWSAARERLAVHGARNAAGEQLWFVHNFSSTACTVPAPVALVDVLDGRRVDELSLAPWDVRILRQVA